jgi:hypothetical protein
LGDVRSRIYLVIHKREHHVLKFAHTLPFVLNVFDFAAAIGLTLNFLSNSPLLAVGFFWKLRTNLLTPA